MLAVLGAATMVAGCSTYGDPGPRYAGYNGWGAYDYDRVDPAYGGYYADRYYPRRPDLSQAAAGQPRPRLCRAGRSAIIAAATTAPRPDRRRHRGRRAGRGDLAGGSGLLGAILGGVGGAAAGQAIDRNNVRCR
ncbi:hypothetical protein AB5I41_18140 [Sphingomonas sp. MMS24-JH45]